MSEHEGTTMQRITVFLLFLAVPALAGERSVVKLYDCCTTELKSAGIELAETTTLRIRAVGGGGDRGWTYKSKDLFAYAWIIDAETRQPVWTMTTKNTERVGDNREFDGTISLRAGSYEVYFVAYAFAHHSAFSNMVVNIDRREGHLFGDIQRKKNFFSWFLGWWTEDIEQSWKEQCPKWGVEILVNDQTRVGTFTPPKDIPGTVIQKTGLGDNTFTRAAFTLSAPVALRVHAIGEGRDENELVDYGWIVRADDRRRVWDMNDARLRPAGGAEKNRLFERTVRLESGTYVLYYNTDDSHSPDDWNAAPPYDPLRWGITVAIPDEKERTAFAPTTYDETKNVIVSLARVKDDEYRTQGFTLKRDTRVRVYAFGERSNNRREMADYGMILDGRTRDVVWSMDVDRTQHAGGAQKNRMLDEIFTLRKGNYIVSYTTDNSHAFGHWNADPPFDPEHYGITIMGVGDDFRPDVVAPYEEERDKNLLAQIIRVRDDANRTERFSVSRPTRVNVYALGEGQGRQMYDYGWIENATTGAVVWEMTYAMTFHAGGGRKNRVVNTTILLEPGEYRLRYRSDDSHAYGDWNVDPPEDQQYWGISLYREDQAAPVPRVGPAPEASPTAPVPPAPRVRPGE